MSRQVMVVGSLDAVHVADVPRLPMRRHDADPFSEAEAAQERSVGSP
jgi:hypothetical protein